MDVKQSTPYSLFLIVVNDLPDYIHSADEDPVSI